MLKKIKMAKKPFTFYAIRILWQFYVNTYSLESEIQLSQRFTFPIHNQPDVVNVRATALQAAAVEPVVYTYQLVVGQQGRQQNQRARAVTSMPSHVQKVGPLQIQQLALLLLELCYTKVNGTHFKAELIQPSYHLLK